MSEYFAKVFGFGEDEVLVKFGDYGNGLEIRFYTGLDKFDASHAALTKFKIVNGDHGRAKGLQVFDKIDEAFARIVLCKLP